MLAPTITAASARTVNETPIMVVTISNIVNLCRSYRFYHFCATGVNHFAESSFRALITLKNAFNLAFRVIKHYVLYHPNLHSRPSRRPSGKEVFLADEPDAQVRRCELHPPDTPFPPPSDTAPRTPRKRRFRPPAAVGRRKHSPSFPHMLDLSRAQMYNVHGD